MSTFFVDEFPSCCTAKLLVDFSQVVWSKGKYRPVSIPKMREELRTAIEDARRPQADDDEWGDETGYGTLVAITTTLQTRANLALKREGFICSDPLYKKRHPESQLLVWYRPLIDAKGKPV
jgi:hypothetical protein